MTDRIYARAPYSARGPRSHRTRDDGIYRRGGAQLTVPLTPKGEGNSTRFAVALSR